MPALLTFERDPETYVEPAGTEKGQVDVQMGAFGPPALTPVASGSEAPVGMGPALSSGPMTMMPGPEGHASNPWAEGPLPTLEKAQGPSGMMKFVALMAALKGDMGPAFNVHNMERKTQVFNAMLPEIARINAMVARGQQAQATERWTQVLAQMSGVAPEVGQLFQPMTEKLYAAEKASATAKGLIAALKVQNAMAEREGNTQRLADNKAFIQYLESIKNFPTEAALEKALKYASTSFSPVPWARGMMATKDTGEATFVPVPETFDVDQLKGPVGQALMAKYRLPPQDLANIMRGNAVLNNQGQDITPSMRPILSAEFAEGQGAMAQRELVKDVPYTPEQNQAMREELKRRGVSDADANVIMATRGAVTSAQRRLLAGAITTGAATPTQGLESAGRQTVADERTRLAEATLRANENVDIRVSAAKDKYVNVGDQLDDMQTFGQDIGGSMKEGKTEGSGRITISRDIHEKTIIPAINLVTALNGAVDALKAWGSPNDPLSALAVGIQKTITAYTGTSSTSITKAKALELITDRAIEDFAKTAQVKSPVVGELKAFVKGTFAREQSAEAAITALQQRMFTVIRQEMRQDATEAQRTFDKLRRGAPSGPLAPIAQPRGGRAPAGTPGSQSKLPASERGSMEDIKAMSDAVQSAVTSRLAITGQQPVRGELVDARDTLLTAQQKLADANQRLMAVESKAPSRGAVTPTPPTVSPPPEAGGLIMKEKH